MASAHADERVGGVSATIALRLPEYLGEGCSVIVVRVLTVDDWSEWRVLRLAALRDAPQAFGSKLADWQGEGDSERRWRGRLDGVLLTCCHPSTESDPAPEFGTGYAPMSVVVRVTRGQCYLDTRSSTKRRSA
jgi:hypothetical protein